LSTFIPAPAICVNSGARLDMAFNQPVESRLVPLLHIEKTCFRAAFVDALPFFVTHNADPENPGAVHTVAIIGAPRFFVVLYYLIIYFYFLLF
jgi:hypothetical protein